MNELSYIHYIGNAEQLRGQLVTEGVVTEIELVSLDPWEDHTERDERTARARELGFDNGEVSVSGD